MKTWIERVSLACLILFSPGIVWGEELCDRFNQTLVGAATGLPNPLTCSRDCAKFVGQFPYGPVWTVATSAAPPGDFPLLAYFGSGPVLRIADISNPATPEILGEILLEGLVKKIVIAGDLAYVVEQSKGLRVVDVSTPSAPVELGFFASPRLIGLTVADGHAFLVDWQSGLLVIDVSTPSAPVEVACFPASHASGVWVESSLAYLAGAPGLWVIDVSTPSAPVPVGQLAMGNWGLALAVEGDFAFLGGRDTSGFSEGLWVIDVSTPSAPVKVGILDLPEYPREVTVAGGYAYLADGDAGLRVIDVSTPSAPVEVGFFDPPRGDSSGVVVESGYAYLADSGSGLRVVDVSTPSAPVEVGFLGAPGPARTVAAAGGFAYLGDQYRVLRVLDVSNPGAPIEVGSCALASADAGTIRSIAVSGGHAYLTGNNLGLRVVDVSTPSAPVEVGYCNVLNAFEVTVAGGYAYLAGDRLWVVDVSTPSAPVELGYLGIFDRLSDVAVAGGYAYVSEEGLEPYPDPGLYVIDVSTPSVPVEVSYVPSYHSALGVAVRKGYAFIASIGLDMIDVSDPSAPIRVATYPISSNGLAEANDYLYVLERHEGLLVLDVSNPSGAFAVGSSDYMKSPGEVVLADGYVYLTNDTQGLVILQQCGLFPGDPDFVGSTHTIGQWSASERLGVTWQGATDNGASDLAGYSVLFDTAAGTLPDGTVDIVHTSDPHSTTSSALPDSASHYFHLRTCNVDGYCTSAIHLGPFGIDATQPGTATNITSPSHPIGSPTPDRTIEVSWSAATDNLSGVAGYGYLFSSSPTWVCDQVLDTPTTTSTSAALGDGSWYFHICTVDNAGNWGPVASAGAFVVIPPALFSDGFESGDTSAWPS